MRPRAGRQIATYHQALQTIYDAIGIRILIYHVIPWNYLSVELMLRIMNEVPGVIGMKQSSGDLKSVYDLLDSIAPDTRKRRSAEQGNITSQPQPQFCRH